jgi:hypothetical protein
LGSFEPLRRASTIPRSGTSARERISVYGEAMKNRILPACERETRSRFAGREDVDPDTMTLFANRCGALRQRSKTDLAVGLLDRREGFARRDAP